MKKKVFAVAVVAVAVLGFALGYVVLFKPAPVLSPTETITGVPASEEAGISQAEKEEAPELVEAENLSDFEENLGIESLGEETIIQEGDEAESELLESGITDEFANSYDESEF